MARLRERITELNAELADSYRREQDARDAEDFECVFGIRVAQISIRSERDHILYILGEKNIFDILFKKD